MTTEEFNNIISYIVENCAELKNKYINENLEIDYICIFSHTQQEYNELLKQAGKIGKIADETPTGPVFEFNSPPKTIIGNPKLLKIRKPDETRPQRGNVDFNSDYENFKKKHLDGRRFTLIKRENFEMLELRDDAFDVLVYFSSSPLSKQLGVTE
ncbi:MAG: hypothetical protein Q7R31_02035 [Candidatus Levybacteria bacterium]|nr:hypothetical protein [Candidatus Levybacteria bacterium]